MFVKNISENIFDIFWKKYFQKKIKKKVFPISLKRPKMDVLGKKLKSVTSESVTSEAPPPSLLGRQGYPENIIKFDHPNGEGIINKG